MIFFDSIYFQDLRGNLIVFVFGRIYAEMEKTLNAAQTFKPRRVCDDLLFLLGFFFVNTAGFGFLTFLRRGWKRCVGLPVRKSPTSASERERGSLEGLRHHGCDPINKFFFCGVKNKTDCNSDVSQLGSDSTLTEDKKKKVLETTAYKQISWSYCTTVLVCNRISGHAIGDK